MELSYNLDEKDFLEYQLYTASKSKNIRLQRRKTFVIMIFACFILFFSAYFYFMKQSSYVLLIFYILILIFYKLYESKYYVNHYKKFVNENYKDRLGLIGNLKFTENKIIEKSKLGESKINYESLTEINEIGDYFFLKFLTAQSLIIPKKKISNLQEFRVKLNEIKTKYNLKENIELNWKWK